MQPTKGVHVVVPSAKLPKTCVAIVSSVSGEKRFLYTLPWEHDLTILGATDTNYTGTADNVNVSVDDVKYLLETFNAGFPNAHLTMKDVVSVFSGLRPLLKVDGNKTGNYSRSREYEIWWTKNNFVNIAGGKLTSFLSMGKHCLDVVAQKFSLSTSATAATENNYTGKWKDMYGAFGKLVEEIIHEDASNTQVLSEKYNYLKAEIIFFTRYQYAQTVADMLTRRTSITYAMKQFDEKLVSDVAQLMAKELDKNTSWKNEQLKNYRDHWTEYHPSFLN
jgi:glycerol-3-phosphate dehydrogenase